MPKPGNHLAFAASRLRRFASCCMTTSVAIGAHGCANADDSSGSVTRDSAGVQIVENSAPLWSKDQQLTLSATPALVIGTQDGLPYQLSRVPGAFRLTDGRIVIADGSSSQLRFYDSTGQHLYSAGRRGPGPGEFRGIYEFFRIHGDTLIAGTELDLLLFTGTGIFIRDAELRRSWVRLPPGGFGVAAWFDSERAIVGKTEFDEPRQPVGTRSTYPQTLAVSDPDSAASPLIGTFTMSPTIVTDRGGGETRRLTPWFSPLLVASSNDSLFFIGYGNEYSIRVYSSRGQLVRIIRRKWIPVAPTADDIERKVAKMKTVWAKADAAQIKVWEHWLRVEPVADTISAFSQFIADDVGRLWVRDAMPIDEIETEYLGGMPQEGSRWSVFDTRGQWLGIVTMPKLFHPKQIGTGFVLGIELRDDGVETIAMYRLQ